MKPWVAGLLVAVPLVSGGPQETSFEPESAYHDGPVIRIQSFRQIDWEHLAPQETRSIPVPSQDPWILERHGRLIDLHGNVRIETAIDVPEELATRRYYLASATGIDPLRLDSARVVTRFEFNPTGTRLLSKAFWGEVFGSLIEERQGPTGGGFVLHPDRPLTFRVLGSELSADDLLLGSDVVAQTADGGYWGRGTAFWEIVAQYRFSIAPSAPEWLFVQWQADREMIEAGCEYRYDLFVISEDGPPARLAWTSYGCDV